MLISKASRKDKLPNRIEMSFGRSNHNTCGTVFHLESQKSSHRNSLIRYWPFQSWSTAILEDSSTQNRPYNPKNCIRQSLQFPIVRNLAGGMIWRKIWWPSPSRWNHFPNVRASLGWMNSFRSLDFSVDANRRVWMSSRTESCRFQFLTISKEKIERNQTSHISCHCTTSRAKWDYKSLIPATGYTSNRTPWGTANR